MTDIWGAKRKRMLFGRSQEEQTQWVVEVTDKWDAKRKRLLFHGTEEQQIQCVVKVTDKWGAKRKRMLSRKNDRQLQEAERKRMLFSRTKNRHDYFEGRCTA